MVRSTLTQRGEGTLDTPQSIVLPYLSPLCSTQKPIGGSNAELGVPLVHWHRPSSTTIDYADGTKAASSMPESTVRLPSHPLCPARWLIGSLLGRAQPLVLSAVYHPPP